MERGEGDKWSKMKNYAAQKVNKSLKDYKIEILFSAHDDDDKGVLFVNWYHGVVDELLTAFHLWFHIWNQSQTYILWAKIIACSLLPDN